MSGDRDRDDYRGRDRGNYQRNWSRRNDDRRDYDDDQRRDRRRYDGYTYRHSNGNSSGSGYVNGYTHSDSNRKNDPRSHNADDDDRRYKRSRTDTAADDMTLPPPSSSTSTEADRSSISTAAAPSSLFRSSVPSDHVSLTDEARRQALLLVSSQTSAPLRPEFLSREQRQKFALERINGRRAENEATVDAIIQGTSLPTSIRQQPTNTAPQKVSSSTSSLTVPSSSSSNDIIVSEKERALIRATYLGGGSNADTISRRRAVLSAAPKGKPKFAFDWASSDDTAAEANALYDDKVDVVPMYGRASIGGIDKYEQLNKSTHYDQTHHESLKQTGHTSSSLTNTANNMIIDKQVTLQPLTVTINGYTKSHDEKNLLLSGSDHWSTKSLSEMKDRDWRIFKEDFEISTRGGGRRVPNPLRSWSESGLPPSLLQTLAAVGYSEPSPIQRAAIPVGLANLDVIGIAETGSGKTAAFLIPMLVFIDKLPRLTPLTAEAGPYAIIMAPSRELAQQISNECTKLSESLGIRNVCIIGGQSIEEQGLSLRNGVEIVIATPGRIYDCIVKRYLVLQQCNYIVLDEADRMIDMNFEPQIINIMEAMPPTNVRPEYSTTDTDMTTTSATSSTSTTTAPHKTHYRQTIMFSATMPPKVENLAKKYLHRPVTIQIGDKAGAASTNVEQRIIWVTSDNSRRIAFKDALQREPPPIIVFCNYKRVCDAVASMCDDMSLSNVVLHGSKAQDVREAALKSFRDGLIDVIVATDVMGRGIDIKNIRHVINYEMPDSIEKYTHRIGRTGRAGSKGVATSLLSDADTNIMFDLKALLIAADQPIPPQLATHDAAKVKPGTVTDKPKARVVFAK